jgi:TnpA family transposase
METKNTTKSELIKAFDKSEKKTAVDVCRIVGITPSSFYFHWYKDENFRRQVIEKKMEFLATKLATTTNGGEYE